MSPPALCSHGDDAQGPSGVIRRVRGARRPLGSTFPSPHVVGVEFRGRISCLGHRRGETCPSCPSAGGEAPGDTSPGDTAPGDDALCPPWDHPGPLPTDPTAPCGAGGSQTWPCHEGAAGWHSLKGTAGSPPPKTLLEVGPTAKKSPGNGKRDGCRDQRCHSRVTTLPSPQRTTLLSRALPPRRKAEGWSRLLLPLNY